MRARTRGIGVVTALLAIMISNVGPAAASEPLTTPDIEMTLSPAPLTGADAIHFVAVDPNGAPDSCTLTVGGFFRGTKDVKTGVVSGSWAFRSAVNCTIPQPRLTTYAYLYYFNGQKAASPAASCTTPDSSPCTAVLSPGGYSCAFCNGPWYARGHFLVSLDPRWTVSTPPQCTRTGLNTFNCQLKTSTTHV